MRLVQTGFRINVSEPCRSGKVTAAEHNKKNSANQSSPASGPQIRFGIHDRWRHQKFTWPLVGFLVGALGLEGAAYLALQQVFKDPQSNVQQSVNQTDQRLDQIEKSLIAKCQELKKEAPKPGITLEDACKFPPVKK